MKFPVLKKENTPPQKALSMEEYADFVEFCLENANIEHARAQKMREEHITTPFSILDGCCSMQSKNLEDKIKNAIPELTRKFPEVVVLYVFGSCAKGNATRDSDVDIAVCIGEQTLCSRPLIDMEIAGFIEKHVGRPVDVVIMEKVSPILQHQVLVGGIRLFERDPRYRVMLELNSFKRYLDARHYQTKRNETLAYG